MDSKEGPQTGDRAISEEQDEFVRYKLPDDEISHVDEFFFP